MRSRTRLIIVSLLMGGCAACANTPADPGDQHPTARTTGDTKAPPKADGDDGYRIRHGDKLRVTFAYSEDFDDIYRVTPAGKIHMPIAGAIAVGGQPPSVAADRVEAAYADELRDPAVNIAPKRVKPITVFVGGQVADPGRYEIERGTSASQAVIAAGGPEPGAVTDEAVLLRRARRDRPETFRFDLAARGSERPARRPLAHQDVVYVPETGLHEFAVWFDENINKIVPLGYRLNYSPSP